MNAPRLFLETVTGIEQSTQSGAAAGEFSARASMTCGLSTDAFEASNGTIWFFPTSEPSIVSAAVSGDAIIKERLHDMTGTLPLHLPHMSDQCYGCERLSELGAT